MEKVWIWERESEEGNANNEIQTRMWNQCKLCSWV